MSNICCTDITIKGCKEDLERIKEAIKYASDPEKEYPGWLGYLVNFLDMNPDNTCCAGRIDGFCMTKDGLEISSYDRWSPQLEPFILLCEQLAPEAKLIYTAIEPGNELYLTNDPVYEEKKWILDTYGEVDNLPKCLKPYVDWEYFTEKDLRSLLNKALRIPDDSSLEFEDIVLKAEEKFDIGIHEMEWCEPDEL